MSDKFNFETNEEFNSYIKICGTTKLLRLYRYCQDAMKKGEVGAIIDALVIYPILREKGFPRKELI